MHIHSPIPWVGGKSALCAELAAYFPSFIERYIEVFGGGGTMLFHRKWSNFEVYNDANGYLANFFRSVQLRPEDLKYALAYVLNSRQEFNRIKKEFAERGSWPAPEVPDIRLASEFLQLIRYSYSASLKSFAGQPYDIRQMQSIIDEAYARLAGVIIENRDFEPLMRQYGRPGAFMLMDPPYYGSEAFYQNTYGFTQKDHIRLRDTAMNTPGNWLITYNDHPFILDLYDFPGIHVIHTSRLHNMRQRYQGGDVFPEIFIANYDLEATRRSKVTQLDLFSQAGILN